jgi:hypothetical protein
MIEAMACGTPVLGFRHGSVPEVIDEGVTGVVVESVEEAIRRMGALLALDRGRVRRQFERRFSASRMAHDYLRIYRRLTVGRERSVPREAGHRGALLAPTPTVQPRAHGPTDGTPAGSALGQNRPHGLHLRRPDDPQT